MADFFEVEEKNIILYGITHKPLGEHRFIVYLNENHNQYCIRVNTDYHEIRSGIYKCCTYYDRGLCNTIKEYRSLTVEAIERQAYGSWMDGAR